MRYEYFHRLKVFNEAYSSVKAKGNRSSAICAYWVGVGGEISSNFDTLRVGLIQYFVKHTVCITASSQSKRIVNVFAKVHWYRTHLREQWFHHRALVCSPDMISCGPATFLPVSRIFCRCAITSNTVKFDYGEDNVIVAILCGSKYSV